MFNNVHICVSTKKLTFIKYWFSRYGLERSQH